MNKRRKFLFASVLALQNSSFIYPSCQRCFSRVVLDSKRFTCPKCGSTGEAKSASYRYKLCIKVAESNKLFVITVFGSCLDTFFGLTANDLHRYLEDSSKIPETLNSARTQSLLTTAVENCFVGQSFVFGVTNFGDVCEHDSDSNNYLQPCCKHKEDRTLVASQIVHPVPHVAGFTVIDYLNHLLHSFNFKKHHCGSQEHSSHSFTLDHSDSDLSSIQGPGETSCFLESCSRDDFFRCWQPSLELTSTDSQLTANDDVPTSEQIMANGTPNQNRQHISFPEVTGSKNCQDPLQSSWSLVSSMDKNNTTGKLNEEFGLQANHLSPVYSSCHETRLSDSDLFVSQMQEPFEKDNAECSKEEKNDYSQYDLPCYQHCEVNTATVLQDRYEFSLSSLKPEETVIASQNCDSLIWDDLPFSESLNKFLAVVESEIAVNETGTKDRKQGIDDIDKFHTNYSRLSVTPRRNARALNTLPLGLKSSQTMMNENSRKETLFSNCESNQSPQIQKESKPDLTTEAVVKGSNRNDTSQYFLPNTCLSALFTSSKGIEVTQKKTTGILQQRNEISLRPSTSTSNCSYLSNKCFNGCGKKSYSGTKEKLTNLYSKKYRNVSDLHKLENTQYHRLSENQDDTFTVCRKLTYPLEILCSSPRSTNTSKEIACRPTNNNLTQSYSFDQEGSYNASADLFEDKNTGTELTKLSQDVLLRLEASCTENYPINENCSRPSQKLPLQSISASTFSRARSQSDSECDFEESQDFVPCSQSTPVAGFHQRFQGLRGTFKMLPSLYSNLNANYKATKVSPENGKHQASPACPKNVKTPSQKSKRPVVSSLTQPETFNHCPTVECLENDVDDWIPPTTKKIFLSDILGFKVTGLRKCLAVHYSPDQKELPRKKLIKVTHKTNMFN
ncbi:DNA damage-induced apoptosis suppressor protein [Meriones unguiculatus]|uniref:DNA damage-induced apoptosis suppressor protein n=1 Tax=Meriones unguiculatus TaxID=10047 RepID=UPI000B4FCCB5|nr:DNA damage-induced apoptosis suppressor protein [Meriones unguiculatus]